MKFFIDDLEVGDSILVASEFQLIAALAGHLPVRQDLSRSAKPSQWTQHSSDHWRAEQYSYICDLKKTLDARVGSCPTVRLGAGTDVAGRAGPLCPGNALWDWKDRLSSVSHHRLPMGLFGLSAQGCAAADPRPSDFAARERSWAPRTKASLLLSYGAGDRESAGGAEAAHGVSVRPTPL